MTAMIDEFEKWLAIQEKPSVNGEMTLGVINEYRTHMCKHAFEGGFNSAQALLSQGEPVGYLRFISNTNVKFIHNLVLKGASPFITPYPDIPVYIAPPSELFGKVEQLELDKAALIEYARKLLYAHELNAATMKKLAHTRIVAEQALSIPQPNCMGNE